jgi:membrane-associated phospholipid phosphatase
MGIIKKIVKKLEITDWLIIFFSLFCISYASIFYKSFDDGKVLMPSRYANTAYQRAKGAETFEQVIELGIREGFYSKDNPPVQEKISYFSVVGYFLIVITIVISIRTMLPPSNLIFRFILGFFPYFAVPLTFNSEVWLHQVNFDSLPFDDVLVYLDDLIFGMQPALEFYALFPYKILEEFFHLAYLNFYMLGLTLAVPIYYARPKENFDRFLSVLLFTFFTSYIIAIIFPSAGPLFYFEDGLRFPYFYQGSLSEYDIGPFTLIMRDLIMNGEIPAGAMPSCHTAIALITTIFAFINFRFWGFIWLFWGVSLWVSTIYLQQHYLIDIFAGLLMAYPIYYYLGGCVYRKLEEKKAVLNQYLSNK